MHHFGSPHSPFHSHLWLSIVDHSTWQCNGFDTGPSPFTSYETCAMRWVTYLPPAKLLAKFVLVKFLAHPPIRAHAGLSIQKSCFVVRVALCHDPLLQPIVLITFTDKMSRCSQGIDGIYFGDLRIGTLLFADDVILLVSLDPDLQLSLE